MNNCVQFATNKGQREKAKSLGGGLRRPVAFDIMVLTTDIQGDSWRTSLFTRFM